MGNRILLADDSITIQKVVNLTFADEGIEVVAVSNGDMAERRLSEVNPDLVLADIFMPGKNGYELCESIKKSAQFHNVPVVLLVGAFEPFDQAEARRVRADAHLTKPFESRTLVETVRKLISSSDQLRAGSPSQSPAASAQGEGQAEAHDSPSAPYTNPDLSPMTTGAAEYTESAPAFEIQLAPDPDQSQPDPISESNWDQQPDLMTPAGGMQEPPSDSFDLAPLEVSANERADAPSMVDVEPVDNAGLMQNLENIDLDLEALDTDLSSGFADDQEMILDLERTEPAYTHGAGNGGGLNIGSERPFSLNTGGLQSESAHMSSQTDSDVFKTQMLETPSSLSPAEERINTNPLEMPPISEFNRPRVTPAGSAQLYEEDSLSSTLLAVDDPLGDVLMDEQEIEALAYEAHSSPEIVFGEEPAGEEFKLEFIPQDQEVFDVSGLTPRPSRVTGELIQPHASSPDASPEAVDAVGQEPDRHAPVENAAVEARSPAATEPYEARPGFESFTTASEPTRSDAGRNWAESGFEFTTDFQVAAPERGSEQVEYDLDASRGKTGEGTGAAPAAEFITSEMWGDQEARFAPIDIEATPVDEPGPATGSTDRDGLETGFEVAPATEQGPPLAEATLTEATLTEATVADATVVEEASHGVAEASPEAESRPAETAAGTAELSPSLIDEIVRRVVARMSESVVREVAWEVVPDVVERVIKEVSREEVSKRI